MSAQQRKATTLDLGPAVIQRLLPLRAPWLMVDRIVSFESGPAPSMRARRMLTSNEAVFQAHYPHIALLPGSLMQEGMAQTSALLTIFVVAQRVLTSRGQTLQTWIEALENVERGARMDRGFQPDLGEALLRAFDPMKPGRVGVLASSHLKYVAPVFPGTVLEYSVRLTRELDPLWHYEVSAQSESTVHAHGTLVNAFVEAIVK